MSTYWKCFGEGLVEIAFGEVGGRQTELSHPAEQLSRVAGQVEQFAVDAVVEVRAARLRCEHSVGTAQGVRFHARAACNYNNQMMIR